LRAIPGKNHTIRKYPKLAIKSHVHNLKVSTRETLCNTLRLFTKIKLQLQNTLLAKIKMISIQIEDMWMFIVQQVMEKKTAIRRRNAYDFY